MAMHYIARDWATGICVGCIIGELASHLAVLVTVISCALVIFASAVMHYRKRREPGLRQEGTAGEWPDTTRGEV